MTEWHSHLSLLSRHFLVDDGAVLTLRNLVDQRLVAEPDGSAHAVFDHCRRKRFGKRVMVCRNMIAQFEVISKCRAVVDATTRVDLPLLLFHFFFSIFSRHFKAVFGAP